MNLPMNRVGKIDGIELLWSTMVMSSYVFSIRSSKDLPGAVIGRMCTEYRKAIQNLTSDEILNMIFYPDMIVTDPFGYEKLKKEFERKLLGYSSVAERLALIQDVEGANPSTPAKI